MPAAINFYAGTDFNIADLTASGLGFYGSGGFGATIPIGTWNGRTFITDSGGTSQGPECDNVKYLNPTGAVLGQAGSGITLNKIPNYLSTVNIRFTYDTPVQVQNAYVRTYDRVTVGSPASGLTIALYEASHLDTNQTATGSGGPGTPTISGAHGWVVCTGGVTHTGMAITSSPGTSGLRPSGASTVDSRHDWFMNLSVSPDSLGAKTQAGLFCYLEYF